LDVVDILGQFEYATRKMGTAQKSAAVSTVFGLRAVAGVNVILKNGTKALRDYRTELGNSTGASDRMSSQIRDTLMGRLKGLESAFEGVKISVFKLRDDALGDLIEKITEVVRETSKVIEENEELGKSFVDDLIEAVKSVMQIFGELVLMYIGVKLAIIAVNAWTLIFKGTLLAYKAVVLAVKGVLWAYKMAVWGLWAAQIALNIAQWASPTTWLIVAIIAIIAVIILAIVYWDDIAAAVGDAWDWIVDKTKAAVDFLVKAFDTIAAPFKGLMESISGLTGTTKKIKAEIEYSQPGVKEDIANIIAGTPEGETLQIVTPEERTASQITSTSEMRNFELLIKDKESRHDVEVTGPKQSVQRTESGEFSLTG
jgi:hypothetical protein